MKPIGKVIRGRNEAIDDYWGDAKAVIELDRSQFDESSLLGIDSFSHIEVIFRFHLVADNEILTGASHRNFCTTKKRPPQSYWSIDMRVR